MDEQFQTLLKTTVPEGFIEAVPERLKSFGITLTEDDAWLVAFSINCVVGSICNECNVDEVPEELFHVAVDMACGEYMTTARNMNKLNMDDINLDGIITQIKEGDTSITFDASASDEQKLTLFINHLLNGRRCELLCYRKMRW